ncbi:MAG TPA: ATP-binding protein [Gammaproteobacteria bacterium]|nr:ATP-binding protein [Gammaproteobacteria bacterium]
MSRVPLVLSWSGGKDGALALEALRAGHEYEVIALLTTLSREHGRISMHGVRETLLDAQAAALDLPLRKIWLPENPDNDTYGKAMAAELAAMRNEGVMQVAFGDLFLEDIRAYRERQLALVGMRGVFPLWKQSTTAIARRFIDRGYRAMLTCVDTEAIDAAFAGRNYDDRLLRELPPGCDPAGENGEFHTFVYAGPSFRKSVTVRTGECVLRDGRFQFCDLLPAA